MKDNISDGDVIWDSLGFSYYISDCIRVDNYYEEYEIFPVGKYDYEKLGLIDNTMLGVDYSSKPVKELGCEGRKLSLRQRLSILT